MVQHCPPATISLLPEIRERHLWANECSREELNLHGFPHTVLSRTRLPFRHVSVSWKDR